MNITIPDSREGALLANGVLLPVFLQAVRDERIAEQDAHLAFALAVPVVAARLELSTRALHIVTEGGEVLYGPGGQTFAEICEEEALEAAEARAVEVAAQQPAPVALRHDADTVPFLGNAEPLYIHLGDGKAYTTWPEAAIVRRPAHRSELPAERAHRAPVVRRTWRQAIRAILAACFGAPRSL